MMHQLKIVVEANIKEKQLQKHGKIHFIEKLMLVDKF